MAFPSSLRRRSASVAFLFLPVFLLVTGPALAANDGDRIGDWTYRCQTLESGQSACGLVQDVHTTVDGKAALLLRITLAHVPGTSDLMVTAVLPLGIHLPTGSAIKVDDGPQLPLTLIKCLQTGCQAQRKAEPALIEALRRGNTLKVGFKGDSQGKTLVVEVSLKGVTAGLNAL